MPQTEPHEAAHRPRVSVLMPTFKQAAFIRRALESLRAQTYTDWELVIVDDGSPDETASVVAPYLVDPRLRYHRLGRNRGLGAALNVATELARGHYLAYLPSDDLFYPDHLARLVATIEARPGLGLSYGGLRWGGSRSDPTLHGGGAVGREAEALANPPPSDQDAPLTGGNLFALVQVLHRRDMAKVRWAERGEVVSDRLEADFWRSLLAAGAKPAYTGAITCEWVWHDEGRTRIIAGPSGGLARYRWILRDNHDACVATQAVARQYDVGLFMHDYADLAAQLRDRPHLTRVTANVRAARPQFAFDTHITALTAFFRRVIRQRSGTR